ncbi:MAG: asparagine synthase (glutamine-hydrolyzing) [Anaeromyxobacter sp.]
MCGIVGIVSCEEALDPLVLQVMADRLAHRGPDGEGFLLASGRGGGATYTRHRRLSAASHPAPARLGLGHRRLSIIDLSERGAQPLGSPDGSAWIVFNGEIYNHLELRVELSAKGHSFVSRTDTEVLLAAYRQWGEACVDRLDGMFAFAIWDSASDRLFCARDRLGIKPFYFVASSGRFAFASEIKALLELPGCPWEPDDAAVAGFLVHGNCDYEERTLFRGIQALPAGNVLTVECGDGRVGLRRYFRFEAAESHPQSDRAHVEGLREALVSVVRSHLTSDVRVGSCLSGGVDSSTVVGLIGLIGREDPAAAAAVRDRLLTFTSCYDDPRLDERGYALEAARSVGADPRLVFPTAEDFWSEFPRMAWHQDMPFGSLSFYAQWRVMRAAAEAGVKVLLDGQGGDEVFGGYAKFRYAYIASLLKAGRLGRASLEVARTFRNADPYVLDLRNGYRYLPAALRRALNLDSVLRVALTGRWREALQHDSTPATRWWRSARGGGRPPAATLLRVIQLDDLTVDTLPQLLRMEDRSSMAYSLEARVPLLDHRLVQRGISLPDHLKVNRGWSKYAVRCATEGVVPDSVRWRTTKLGFAAPDRRWLLQDLRVPISDLLRSDLRVSRYVDPRALSSWYEAPRNRRANTECALALFRILSLETWMRAFSL